ncbi:hypothetical protein ONS96_007533 [Cadophora gregata f. sp. sojae]|nr:hypothetical protein ONS96_007533 [Cadophora gregata f. sp. sojae]
MADPQTSIAAPLNLLTPPTTSPSASIRQTSNMRSRTGTPSLRKPQQLVTLLAGDSPTKFVVHTYFACHYSPVFDAAFNGNFLEGQTQEYKIQDVGEETVRLLVHWLYTQKLDTIELQYLRKHHDPKDFGVDSLSQTKALIQLWVLGEKLLIPRVQNSALDEILRIRYHTGISVPTQYLYIYENTSAGSPLRRFFVDLCVSRCKNPPRYNDSSDRYPKEMLLDIITKLTTIYTKHERLRLDPKHNMAAYRVLENSET